MGKFVIVNGATTKCTGSEQSSFLLVPPDLKIEIDGLNPATIAHHTPGDNIIPFGPCKHLGGGQCVPFTLSPWEKGEPSVPFGPDPSLNTESRLKCDLGGTIKLLNPGQSIPFLSTDCNASLPAQLFAEWYAQEQGDVSREAEDENENGASPVMPMLGVAGTVAVADGPLPFGDVIGLGIVAAAGGIAIAHSVSEDDFGNDVASQDDIGDVESDYDEYEYQDSRENKRGPLKGGTKKKRDKTFGIKNPDFWKHVERTKPDRGDILDRGEAERRFKEWEAAGRPSR